MAKENNRMAIMMKAEERRRQMEEDIRNLKETKKNIETNSNKCYSTYG